MPASAARVGQEAPQVRLDVVHLSPVQTVATLETDALDLALSTGCMENQRRQG